LRRPGQDYPPPRDDAIEFLNSLADVPAYMWTPEEEEEEEEEEQQSQPPPKKQAQPSVKESRQEKARPQPAYPREFKLRNGRQVEDVPPDGNCFYW
jgi:hypothetical protein